MSFVLRGYRIKQQIGLGAGARIYAAVKTDTNQPVAIKRVPRNSPADDVYVQQAENEYEVSSKIKSKYIRHAFELHRVRKLLQLKEIALVMEYVDGLAVEKARPNRLNTFLKLMGRVAAGLHAMHEQGYVHTDIKPSNIMVERGGAVKIIDFGQACPIGHRKDRIQGTPDFIAPEQVRKAPLDQRTDIFNLGATMYWLLTSQHYPTGLDTDGDDMGTNQPNQAVEPIVLNDKIPRPLSNLVMECCRESQSERPSDMMTLVGRIESIRRLWKKQREDLREQMAPGKSASEPQTRMADYPNNLDDQDEDHD